MTALLAASLAILASGGEFTVFATDSALRVIQGSGEIRFVFQNTSDRAQTDLRLAVDPGPLAIAVRPEWIARCLPGERATFSLEAQARSDTPAARFDIGVRLESREGVCERLMLRVDASPTAADRSGWMDAGVIELQSRSGAARIAWLAMASAVPLLVLLWFGWRTKRHVQQPKG